MHSLKAIFAILRENISLIRLCRSNGAKIVDNTQIYAYPCLQMQNIPRMERAATIMIPTTTTTTMIIKVVFDPTTLITGSCVNMLRTGIMKVEPLKLNVVGDSSNKNEKIPNVTSLDWSKTRKTLLVLHLTHLKHPPEAENNELRRFYLLSTIFLYLKYVR
jgi:hypothetical protein